ncbi:MAG: hypothetical protein HEP71_05000 [Roseivirga sp.]|nr:hypothetical protein [Roseivirga sp.]
MRKAIILVFTIFPFTSLAQNDQVQAPCHFHDLKKETTPQGKTIDYRRVNDSIYHIHYGREGSLRRVPGDFHCTAPVLTKPHLEAENEQFILLSHRCGYACRIGHILPMDADLEIKALPHWLTYDLDMNVIVSMDYDFPNQSMHIKIMELTTYKEKIYNTGVSCDYGIPIDCFQEVKVDGNRVVITWDKDIKTTPYEIALNN